MLSSGDDWPGRAQHDSKIWGHDPMSLRTGGHLTHDRIAGVFYLRRVGHSAKRVGRVTSVHLNSDRFACAEIGRTKRPIREPKIFL